MDRSDALWLILAATLVMSMQVGFCMLETGLVRSKNTINVAMKNLLDFCVATLCFWAFGFALMFGLSAGGWLGTSDWLYRTFDTDQPVSFFIYQVMFCATAATIVSGAVAERMSFRGYLFVTFVVSGLIYPLVGHWLWNEGGWLAGLGFVDFAGSSVVHGVGGWTALAAIAIIGPRTGRFTSATPLASSHSLVTATFGTLILFVGWLGFNGGSRLAFTPDVPDILLTTVLAGCTGAMVALAVVWAHTRLPRLPDTLNGAIAGLVAITANCHAVTPLAAVAIGAIGALVGYGFTLLLVRWKLDDVVGASAAHGAAGAWGTLAVALFGQPELLGTGLGFWPQLGVQALGVAVVMAAAGGGGWLLLQGINVFAPLRASAESEQVGLNVAEHGASTEIIDLLTEMSRHSAQGDFSHQIHFEPFTEVGQIATEYNRVIAKVADEMEMREGIAARLRLEQAAAQAVNDKIVGSIEYARRIQQAMLPSEATLRQALGNFGLLYLPRDIVSGDFYWCHRTPEETFIAVVDCTGHGVPGAFMSLIGHALLQQVIVEGGLREPAEVLEELHGRIGSALGQSASRTTNRDGMDMCLCRLDADEVVFAGANRPLWWSRAGRRGSDAFGEIKGVRQSLGGGLQRRRHPFVQHRLPKVPGLTIYLGSDGYVDQPNHLREPFDLSRLRELLKELRETPPVEQVRALQAALDRFSGGADQRDDITLLAIRFDPA